MQSLKRKIQVQTGTPIDEIQYIFKGQALDDGCRLSDYKIRANSTIYLRNPDFPHVIVKTLTGAFFAFGFESYDTVEVWI